MDTKQLAGYLRGLGGDPEDGSDGSSYDAMLHLAADALESAIPEHVIQHGRYNFLTRNALGEWWVSTRDADGQPRSGMPLDMFVEYYELDHPVE